MSNAMAFVSLNLATGKAHPACARDGPEVALHSITYKRKSWIADLSFFLQMPGHSKDCNYEVTHLKHLILNNSSQYFFKNLKSRCTPADARYTHMHCIVGSATSRVVISLSVSHPGLEGRTGAGAGTIRVKFLLPRKHPRFHVGF